MDKKEVWQFLGGVRGAQEFVKEVSEHFELENIKVNNKGRVVIWTKSPAVAPHGSRTAFKSKSNTRVRV